MSDYEVGYGKPPKHSRFKPGNTAGRAGRPPKAKSTAIAGIIVGFWNATAEYRQKGETKRAPRQDLTIRTYVTRAQSGDLRSIEALLQLRNDSLASGHLNVRRLEISDWQPDYPGQTGEQKTHEFAARQNAAAPAWWKDVAVGTEDKGE